MLIVLIIVKLFVLTLVKTFYTLLDHFTVKGFFLSKKLHCIEKLPYGLLIISLHKKTFWYISAPTFLH